MMVIFEVFVAPGSDPESIISEQIKRETQAQVMTLDEARKVGFGGLQDQPDKEVRLVAVAKRDAAWIQRTLEINSAVGAFKMYDVD